MTAPHNGNGHGNGHLNGNGRLVVEDNENLSFSVNRKVFVSDDVLEAEHRAIFDHCWIYVGHASELKQPNDFRTRNVAGRPVIFCRDRQGDRSRADQLMPPSRRAGVPRARGQRAAVLLHLSRLDVQHRRLAQGHSG